MYLRPACTYQPLDKHTRSCLLESLNNDVLIAVLAASGSFSDLASFIRASPAMLQAFLSAKPTILLHVTSNILGPATRDAAFLAEMSVFDGEDYEAKVDAAVQEYSDRLSVTSSPWVSIMGADTAVKLVAITRLAQFFGELFVQFSL